MIHKELYFSGDPRNIQIQGRPREQSREQKVKSDKFSFQRFLNLVFSLNGYFLKFPVTLQRASDMRYLSRCCILYVGGSRYL